MDVIYSEYLFGISQVMLRTNWRSASHKSLLEYFTGNKWDIIPVNNLLFYLPEKKKYSSNSAFADARYEMDMLLDQSKILWIFYTLRTKENGME